MTNQNSTDHLDRKEQLDPVAREARWQVAMERGDQRVALRTIRTYIANHHPAASEFWQQVHDHIVSHDLGWRVGETTPPADA